MPDPGAFNAIVDSLQLSCWYCTRLPAAPWHVAHDAGAQEALLRACTAAIGAEMLTCSSRDYEPCGASAALVLGEPQPVLSLAHLDASHICAHSYPDIISDKGWHRHRLDLAVSTCGFTSPLACLDLLLEHEEPDLIEATLVRHGLTRDENDRWHDGGTPQLPTSLAPGYRWQQSPTPRGFRLIGISDDAEPDQIAGLTRDLYG